MEKQSCSISQYSLCSIIFFVASAIFAYLLYKLYTCTHNRTTIWFCREKAPVTLTDVSYVVGQDDQESTVNINGRSSGDNLNVTDTVSPPTKRAPRMAKFMRISRHLRCKMAPHLPGRCCIVVIWLIRVVFLLGKINCFCMYITA